MEIQKVPASHGMLWIKHGFRLIMRSPLQAVALTMVFALGLMLAMMIPVGGVLFAMLLMPVLLAGYMRVCRALEYSESVSPRFIFAGFEKRTAQLVTIGGMLLAGMLVVSMVTVMMGGDALNQLLNDFQKHQDSRMLMEAMMAPGSGVMAGMLTGLILVFALMMALQYAPMLVFFDQMAPLEAVKLSLAGSLRNIVPLTVYSMLMQVLAFMLSVVPFNLGLIILLPLGLTSIYVSYRDIFAETKKEGEPEVVKAVE